MVFLKTTDTFERDVMLAIAHAADELENENDQRRATHIANAVGRMLGGGK